MYSIPELRIDSPTLNPSHTDVASSTAPTAFTPLADVDGSVTHPYWPRMDRCIDYIWVSEAIGIAASGVCFDQPSADDPSLWPSDHAGVWADLELG